MLLKYFYDSDLAHASYLVGCQQSGEAIIIDPSRYIAPYLEAAEREGMRIIGAAETHIHADYVSGSRELAEACGARLFLSAEGGPDWQYEFAQQYDHHLLRDGDKLTIGKLELEVMHTPGHTPESISYLLTDRGGGATSPMGIFTGDFVFVGSLGRPDLLEAAVGQSGAAAEGAGQMFRSVQKFMQLDDFLQVWPAHGAGSSCGKGLGAVPSSTVGYEKRFNPMLGYASEGAFTEALLAGQPEPPRYYGQMKRVNRLGPAVLGSCMGPVQISAEKLPSLIAQHHIVIDTSPRQAFAAGHVPGSINIEMGNLASWAGWFVDYRRPVTLIVSAANLERAVRILRKIGVDEIASYAERSAVEASELATQAYETMEVEQLAPLVMANEVSLVDVRAASEWEAGRLPNAQHIMLGYLTDKVNSINAEKPVVLQCRSGSRSALAASVAQAAGIKRVINMQGGILAWQRAGLPIEQ